MRYERCVSCHSFVGWAGLVTNSVLLVLKAFIGVISGSHALVADSMYSAKDVITSVLVIVGFNVARKPLDREHPYGHGKVEFILALFIGLVFIVATLFILIQAVRLLFIDLEGGDHPVPHMIALWTALISVIINAYMYFYSRCVSIEVNSPMVRTLSMHHHADMVSSAAVALGILGAHYLMMSWIDTVVALFETLHLMYLGGAVCFDAYKGLMDRNASSLVRQRILHCSQQVEGVASVAGLRCRHVGQDIFVDMTIAVDSQLSIEKAKNITDSVAETLYKAIAHLGDVNVKFKSTSISKTQ